MEISGMRKKTAWVAIPVWLLFFVTSLFAEKPLVFFSQPARLAQQNLDFFSHRYRPLRQIVPLIGSYTVIDPDNRQVLGKVNAPSVFHLSKPLIFRKQFSFRKENARRYFLNFEGLNGFLEIRVNDRLIYSGSHNFLPLRFVCPNNILTDSSNVLEIFLRPWQGKQNEFPRWMPVNLPRIDNGITAPVYLESTPPVFISNLTAEARSDSDSTMISGTVTLQTGKYFPDGYVLDISIRNRSRRFGRIRLTVPPDSAHSIQKIPFKVKIASLPAWSPEKPFRNFCRVRLRKGYRVVDEWRKSLLIRKISVHGRFFHLNGKTLKINGVNYVYQDQRGVGLLHRQLILQDLQQVKAKGFNAVRIGFYPASSLVYHLTDSLGLLCFQDLPFTMLNEKIVADSLLHQQALNYMRSFLTVAAEHPSVVAIAMGNHLPESEEYWNRFAREIRELLRGKADLQFYSCLVNPQNILDQDTSLCCVELMSRNHQENYLSHFRQLLPGKIALLFSGISKAISYRVDSTAITHDLRQITELYIRLKQPEWKNRLAGQFVLTYSDFYLETPALQAGPRNRFLLNSIGLFNLHREMKKDAATVLSSKKLRLPVSEVESERKNLGTFLFILIGLINFLIFLTVYRAILEFRQNIKRAIRKPHGFFSDLKERRLIPLGESLFLVAIISVNGAIMLGSIFYFFRNNFFMDYLLSLLFPFQSVKLALSEMIWKPLLMVPVLTAVIMLLFFLLAIPIRLRSVFLEPLVRNRQALAVSAWAAAPFAILLPLGMFFYSLLLVLNSYWILFIILLYFHLWYALRWMNGTRVMIEIPYARVLLFSLVFLIIAGGAAFYFWQQQVDISEHFRFLFHLYRTSIQL